jgi:hypothetical protein
MILRIRVARCGGDGEIAGRNRKATALFRAERGEQKRVRDRKQKATAFT